MKSVLDVAGYFLYLGSMCIILPIMLVLYLMLTCWRALVLMQVLWMHGLGYIRFSAAATSRLLKQRLQPARKWQLNWHMHKAQ